MAYSQYFALLQKNSDPLTSNIICCSLWIWENNFNINKKALMMHHNATTWHLIISPKIV